MPADEELEQGGGSRPFWSGTISFGLVSIPVAIFAANRPRTSSLKMVSEEGTPLQRRYVCSEDEQELDWSDIVRGYEIEKGKFVVVTDDELEAIEPRKSREIDLRLFVARDEIDPKYFERGYFLTPAGGSNKAYRLLAAIMERTGRVGVATFVMRTKEYVVAILAENGILRAETLRFADEIRSPGDVGLPKVAKAPAAEVKWFDEAIRKQTGKLDLHEMLDDYAERLEALARDKQKRGEGVVEQSVPIESDETGGEVVDLLEVLSRSLGGTTGAKRKPARKAPAKPKGGTARKSRAVAPSRKRPSAKTSPSAARPRAGHKKKPTAKTRTRKTAH
ncbi:MAG: Ku protein [Thermoanaerobaculia bacterium]